MQYNDNSHGGDSISDNMTKEERGKQMALVKNKHTKLEIELRHLFWKLGYHYRYANWIKLPGKPNLVFLHGFFWQGHPGCPNTRLLKSTVEFRKTRFPKIS